MALREKKQLRIGSLLPLDTVPYNLGHLLVGRYESIDIEELSDGVMQGYSAMLNLHLRWEQGRLAWHDPATSRPILTYDDQRARDENERAALMEATTRAEAAEAELHRLREG